MKPQWPAKDTQCWQILCYMIEAGQITPLGALSLCGCLRLSERIRDCEALGWSIKHEWVKLPNGKRVMGY